MSTFYGDGGMHVLTNVGMKVAEIEATMDVHTVTLVLNGQHGEFDLTIIATDRDMEDHTFQGVARRSGSVWGVKEVSR